MHLNRLVLIIVFCLPGFTSAISQPRLRLELPDQVQQCAVLSPLGTITQEGVKQRKSVGIAILYSVLLPGLGDIYADNLETGKYFLIADGGLWLTYGGFRAYGVWQKSDAETFAVQWAGANFTGKDDKFEVNLGNFPDVASYNDAKLRNREYELLYDPNSNFAWRWSSDADRLRYKDLRNRGEETLRNSQFVLGALVLNRIMGIISAARSVSAYNRNLPDLGGWHINARPQGGLLAADGIEITFSRHF